MSLVAAAQKQWRFLRPYIHMAEKYPIYFQHFFPTYEVVYESWMPQLSSPQTRFPDRIKLREYFLKLHNRIELSSHFITFTSRLWIAKVLPRNPFFSSSDPTPLVSKCREFRARKWQSRTTWAGIILEILWRNVFAAISYVMFHLDANVLIIYEYFPRNFLIIIPPSIVAKVQNALISQVCKIFTFWHGAQT